MIETQLTRDDYKRRMDIAQKELTTTHEAASEIRKQNQELIRKLKEENKHYRQQLAALKKFKIPLEDVQVERKQQEITQAKLKLDKLRADNQKLQRELFSLRDKLKELELNSKRPSAEDSPHLRQIRILENRLDKAMIKHNEAQSIRKTYEQIVARLRAERVGFDQQLAKVERTLRIKEHDFEELVLLSHDANHAREMAQAELHRFEQLVWEEKQEMAKEVAAKKALVTARMQDGERLERKERALRAQKDRDANAAGVSGINAGDTVGLRSAGAVADFAVSVSHAESEETRARAEEYEEAFRRIKEATGVSDVNEVIQKFLTQEDTQNSLIAMTRTNEEKLARLRREKKDLLSKLEEVRFASSSGSDKPQMAAFDMFQLLQESNSKVEKAKARYQSVQDALLKVRAGVAHLALLLSGISLDGDTYAANGLNSGANADSNNLAVAQMVGGVGEEMIEDMLAGVDLKLQKLLSVVDTSQPLGNLQQTSYMDPDLVDTMGRNARVNMEDDLNHTPGGIYVKSPIESPDHQPSSDGDHDEQFPSEKELQQDIRAQRKSAKDISTEVVSRETKKSMHKSPHRRTASVSPVRSPGGR